MKTNSKATFEKRVPTFSADEVCEYDDSDLVPRRPTPSRLRSNSIGETSNSVPRGTVASPSPASKPSPSPAIRPVHPHVPPVHPFLDSLRNARRAASMGDLAQTSETQRSPFGRPGTVKPYRCKS